MHMYIIEISSHLIATKEISVQLPSGTCLQQAQAASVFDTRKDFLYSCVRTLSLAHTFPVQTSPFERHIHSFSFHSSVSSIKQKR